MEKISNPFFLLEWLFKKTTKIFYQSQRDNSHWLDQWAICGLTGRYKIIV